ncbi:MAG: efflux RND transporter periplasmic adaptor subunit, partial [Pseudolabrys sp.]
SVSVRLKLDNGTLYPEAGKLVFIESNVSEATGTVGVRAIFPNPHRLLLPGMYVRAIVEEGVAPNSFLVPQRAVTRNTKGEPTAMFVGAGNKVEQRVLAVERNVGNNWLVTTGIHDGDRVIVEGTQLVRPGQVVTPVEVTIDENTGEVRGPKQGALSTPHMEQLAQRAQSNAVAGN